MLQEVDGQLAALRIHRADRVGPNHGRILALRPIDPAVCTVAWPDGFASAGGDQQSDMDIAAQEGLDIGAPKDHAAHVAGDVVSGDDRDLMEVRDDPGGGGARQVRSNGSEPAK